MFPNKGFGPSRAQQQHTKKGALLPLLTVKRKARKAKSADIPSLKMEEVVGHMNLDDGFLHLMERGRVPPNYDMERALTVDGPIRTAPLPLYSKKDRPRQRIMTEDSGFVRQIQYKLDYSEIEKLPSKLNMSELKSWEVEMEEEEAATSTTSSSSSSKTAAPPAAERDDPRTYTELLDLYSMHEFIIRKGKTLRNTPEFASFKRNFLASWGNIENIIDALEQFLNIYGIEVAYVDGKKVAALAAYQPDHIIYHKDLVECIANWEDVEPLLGNVRQQFVFGQKGHHVAAAKIQSVWRMYWQRIAYMHLLIGTRAATAIQRQWAIHRAHCTTKRAIHTVTETRYTRWKQTMEEFMRKWPRIRDSPRTVIHIPSLSYPSFHAKKVPFFFARQMGQITRLCDLADRNVELVVVSPFKPEPEVMEYYVSLLEDAGIENPSGRITMLVPEDLKRLPEGMSLTRYVLFSHRLMKLLAALCKGKPAYIIPGVIGVEELTLAAQLNVPLLGPEPKIAQVFGTKSGCIRLLEAAEVITPSGAHQLRSRTDLLRALANLMIEHREVPRWLIKLDTESGSRGHAFFDSSRMKALKEERSDQSTPLFNILLQELEDHGAKRVRLIHPGCYADWTAYLAMVDKVGASITAAPSKVLGCLTANMFIEPSGEVHLESVVEPLLAPAYTVMGSCFPRTTQDIPYEAVRDAALSVGRSSFRKRIMGYMSVDFVVVERTNASGESTPRLWGVDVDLYLTNNALAHKFACLITGSQFNPKTGKCPILRTPSEELTYAYSGMIYNPFISSIRHAAFFSQCRSKGLSYDRNKKNGLVFHLVDVLLRGCIGVISVGTNTAKAVRKISEFQSIMNLELPKQGEHSSQSNFVYFSTIVRQLERLVKTARERQNSN